MKLKLLIKSCLPQCPKPRLSVMLAFTIAVSACGGADLTGESKKRQKNPVAANQTVGDSQTGAGDSSEQYGTTADGKPCLKDGSEKALNLQASGPNQGPTGPGQTLPPGKGTEVPPGKGPGTPADGREPAPIPPCGPVQSGGEYTKGGFVPGVDVAVDINKNGNGPLPPPAPFPGIPCIGKVCVSVGVGVGVGKGGPGCGGPQCPVPPPPPPGQPIPAPLPPPGPGACPGAPGGLWGGGGKIWNKWQNKWQQGPCI